MQMTDTLVSKNKIARSIGRAKGCLRNARSEFRVLALVAIGLLATYGFSACTWGWADNNCNDSNCVGQCTNSTHLVIEKTYCQQQGNLCCQCTELAYRCISSGPCSTSFWYDRTKLENAGNCASGENGLECTF